MKAHLIRPHTRIVALSLLMSGAAWAQPPGPPPPPPPGPGGPPPPVPMQTDALGAIQRAHDTVNQAVSFAQISKDAEGVSLGPLVTQGKTAYQEALSRYQASDLIGARELATAANDVSRAVVELATTMTQANGQVPQPPTSIGVNDDAFRANDDLARAGRTILEAQGTLSSYGSTIPAPAAAEARGLLTTSQQLQQRGQALLAQNQPRDASAVARAADALAHAASHLQNRYLIAAGLVPPEPPPPGPPPPGGRGRGRGRGPGG